MQGASLNYSPLVTCATHQLNMQRYVQFGAAWYKTPTSRRGHQGGQEPAVQDVHRETENPGFDQPGEGKAERGCASWLQWINGRRGDRARLFLEARRRRTSDSSHRLHHGKFQWGITKKFSMWGYTGTGDQEFVRSPWALCKPVGHLALRWVFGPWLSFI